MYAPVHGRPSVPPGLLAPVVVLQALHGLSDEEAVGLPALIAGQDVEPAAGSDGRWRIARRTAPDRIISTVDPQARHIHKSGQHRDDGHKAGPGGRAGDRAVHRRRVTPPVLEPPTTRPPSPPACSPPKTVRCRSWPMPPTPPPSCAPPSPDAGHRLLIKTPALKPAVAGGFTPDDFAIDTSAGTIT
ncbi:hypothetical protein [Nonomuraea sp. JJY05]|uniref:hypothetical protein n=1 Tax=Nonomuraea sp. JJY05 TaxID=3350255 RepID=UPI00373F3289